ncbi:MAG: type VI secretion system baseplate subunit TssG [Holosporaceae bacterium]|jgi:type VI secretion system protein ImpH|nr:type VI secretion system baseplate subunit TssG [Holosporaceae bacterium]
MEATVRHTELPLNEELLLHPKQFSFEMAAYILEYGAEVSFGKETTLESAPFGTKSVISFHLKGTEIDKILPLGTRRVIYTERLALAGLGGPLPIPYTELIFRRGQMEDFAMGEFLNMFNARLLGISYQISKRRYLCLQRHDGASLLQNAMATFFGESPRTFDRRVARLSHLFWTKEKSADGLEAVISSFCGFKTMVKELCAFWVDRQEVQLLGNIQLGSTAELGKKLYVLSFGIEIHLSHSGFEKIFQLLLDKRCLENLKWIIKKYLGVFFNYTLVLNPQNVPLLVLGKAFLGKTSWIPGKNLDSAKIVC